MKLQDKVFETATVLRARAAAFVGTAGGTVRTAAGSRLGAERLGQLRSALATLQNAGREFNRVARRHVARLIKENSVIARDAGKEVRALALTTYGQLADRQKGTIRKPRKVAARKRSARVAHDKRANAA